MIIAFQIILFIITLISFFGTLGEKDTKRQQTHGAVIIATIGALLVTFIWL